MTDDDLLVQDGIVIPAAELRESASRASGPGGQHVNKSNTRVTVRWSLGDSVAFSAAQKQRLETRLGARLTKAGEIVVHAAAHRSRARNRALAWERLAELIREALRARRPRVRTRASARVRARGVEAKRRRSATKRARGRVQPEHDA